MQVLSGVMPGRALDLACGGGRHAIWLRERGWQVTAVDIAIQNIDGVTCVQADLESNGFEIESGAWDLIVCWLYWQKNLLPAIAAGVRMGGHIALAGKTSGQFATSLERYRQAFTGWQELSIAQDEFKAWYIAVKA